MTEISDLIKLAKERGFLFEKEILDYFGCTNSDRGKLLDVFNMIKDMDIEIKTENE